MQISLIIICGLLLLSLAANLFLTLLVGFYAKLLTKHLDKTSAPLNPPEFEWDYTKETGWRE